MIVQGISKKVLNVGENYETNHGGISSVLNTYSKYFSTFNFVPTYKPQPVKILGVPYFLIGFIKLLWKLLTDNEVKLVHIHGAAKGSFFRKFFIFLASKYLFRKKVIYHIHGSEFRVFYRNSSNWRKSIIASFLNKVDVVICLSRQWEDFFQANFKIKSVIVLENIVEPAIFTKFPRSSSTSLQLLFLGAIGDRKGIFDLLAVINENKNQWEGKVHLTIGGSGEINRLENFIRDNQLENMVTFKGWIRGSQKQLLLAESDLYILPSYNEGLPISILEALSYNLPVITTPVGGITEIVHNNVNGFIVHPGDRKDIYNKIMKFIETPELLTIMGKASRDIIAPYYVSSVMPKLNAIYSGLLSNNFKPL